MDFSPWHVSQPAWLWTLLAIPLVGILLWLYDQRRHSLQQLEIFIDKHLIPYLLPKEQSHQKKTWFSLVLWSLAWACLALALAGPRWDFREIAPFRRDQSLAILLDLSESMNAADIAPSRLVRAKQKIEELLRQAEGVKIGLIAFAADPHMIVPLTEDTETIRHLLPSLDSELVYAQGSKLAPALEMAQKMLQHDPGHNRAIAVISDGGFEDAQAIHTAKKLGEQGVVIYAIGVGSVEGTTLKNRRGNIIKKNGSPIISRLEKERFQEISTMGQGRYFDSDQAEPLALIFADLQKRSDLQQEVHKTQRLWQERFSLFLLPVLPCLILWFQRGYLFLLLFLSFTPHYASAALPSYFYNTEQRAQQAYMQADYAAASRAFHDPYRKGVACYRMGEYATAEELFRQSHRPEVAASAAYNLGNALVQQNKLAEAVTAYEEVLARWPDHQAARENLALVQKMLAQPQPPPDDRPSSSQPAQPQNQTHRPQGQQESAPPAKDKHTEEPPAQPAPPEADPSQTPLHADRPESSQSSTPETKDHRDEPSEVPHPQPGSPAPRSQDDLDADLWLNQIKNDPKSFLKNKFHLESKKNRISEEVDPW